MTGETQGLMGKSPDTQYQGWYPCSRTTFWLLVSANINLNRTNPQVVSQLSASNIVSTYDYLLGISSSSTRIYYQANSASYS
jgi:hypothetical protein